MLDDDRLQRRPEPKHRILFFGDGSERRNAGTPQGCVEHDRAAQELQLSLAVGLVLRRVAVVPQQSAGAADPEPDHGLVAARHEDVHGQCRQRPEHPAEYQCVEPATSQCVQRATGIDPVLRRGLPSVPGKRRGRDRRQRRVILTHGEGTDRGRRHDLRFGDGRT